MTKKNGLLERFHHTLVVEISSTRPEYLKSNFTVAEIYQNLIPYRSHRDVIGVEMNGDYENALLRLLGGEGGYLFLESEPALREIQNELLSSNPNTGLFREYAAAEVRLNPERLESDAMKAAVEAGAAAAEADEQVKKAATAIRATPVTSASAGTPARGEEGETTVLPFERPAAAAARSEGATTAGKQCPQCRDVLPDREGLRFCPACGTNVLVVSCTSCGEQLERGWRFCVACGSQAPR